MIIKVFIFSLLCLVLSNCGGPTLPPPSNTEVKNLKTGPVIADFGKDFIFGIATAPGQAEDELKDAWARHAELGFIPAFFNTPQPYNRLKFWSNPSVEINLTRSLGVDLYRYGIDWARLAPHHPKAFCTEKNSSPCLGGIQDQAAWQAYKQRLFANVRGLNLKTMLTLFHHSAPIWFVDSDGWLNKKNTEYFINFSKSVIDELKSEGIPIDYWITINEPTIMAMHSYVLKMWPGRKPGQKPLGIANLINYLQIGPLKGTYYRAIDNMIYAHKELYSYIHQQIPSAKVSLAHNVAQYGLSGRQDVISRLSEWFLSNQADWTANHYSIQNTVATMDFIGINYYGEETITATGPLMRPDREYMDSGRGINPNGMYEVIMKIHQKYNLNLKKSLPIFITENGISDTNDVLRPAYIVEHLLAVNKLQKAGVNMMGYIFWTLSDNFEWSDGYCPKFGLFSVDRNDIDLKLRSPRNLSVNLFKEIANSKTIFQGQRDKAWQVVRANIGKPRPMCRDKDGITAFDEEIFTQRNYVDWDWRLF